MLNVTRPKVINESRRSFLRGAAGLVLSVVLGIFHTTELQASTEATKTTQDTSAHPEVTPLRPVYTTETIYLDHTAPIAGQETQAAATMTWKIAEVTEHPDFTVTGENITYYKITGEVPKVIGGTQVEIEPVEYYAYAVERHPLTDANFSWDANTAITEFFRPQEPITPRYVQVTNSNGKEEQAKIMIVTTDYLELGIMDTTGKIRDFVDSEDTQRTITTTGRELKVFLSTGVSQSLEKQLAPSAFLTPDNPTDLTAQPISPQLFTWNNRLHAYDSHIQVAVDRQKVLPLLAELLTHLQLMHKVDGLDEEDEARRGKAITQIVGRSMGTDIAGLFYGNGPDAVQVINPNDPTKPQEIPAVTFLLNTKYMNLQEFASNDVIAHEMFHSYDFRLPNEILEKLASEGKFSSLPEAMAVVAMFLFSSIENAEFVISRREVFYLAQYLADSANSFTALDYYLYVVPLYLINKYGISADKQDFMKMYLNARDEIEAAKNRGEDTPYSSTDPAHAIHWVAMQKYGYTGPLIDIQEANRQLLLDIMKNTAPPAEFLKLQYNNIFATAAAKEYTGDSAIIDKIFPMYKDKAVKHSWAFRDVGPVETFTINFFEANIQRAVTAATQSGETTVSTSAVAGEPTSIPNLCIFIPWKNEQGYKGIITDASQTSIDLTREIQTAQRELGVSSIRILILNDTPSNGIIGSPTLSADVLSQNAGGYLLQFEEQTKAYTVNLPIARKP